MKIMKKLKRHVKVLEQVPEPRYFTLWAVLCVVQCLAASLT